jgi:acyl-coenzyme A thioesterase PaaI-like protein
MEKENNINKNTNEIKELEVNEFKRKYFKILSPYFNKIFSDYIKKIIVERQSEKYGTITFDVQMDEKSANSLGIAHGGALATLMENLATVSLFYFSNMKYKTLDISVNYKNQVELNKTVKIIVNCQKIGLTTTFTEVAVMNGTEICTNASIIKTKMEAKF